MEGEQFGRRSSSPWVETGVRAEANQVDDWIAVEPDGSITAFSGKVELGTGVRTALAQIVAEELDVPLERVHMVMGDTARTPNEGYTAGSKTVQTGGSALRRVCAEARRALLEMAGEHLDASPEELTITQGVIVVSYATFRAISYGELMGGKRFNRSISGAAPAKRTEEYHTIGKSVPRVDLPRKFTGEPSFVDDVRVPGMLHGRVVRPPSPEARLISIEESSVQDARVVRLGNFVGIVAEREEVAARAAADVRIQWSESARLPGADELYGYLRGLPTTERVVRERGHVSRALEKAVTRVSATYYQPYQAHASIGPSCAVADLSDGRLTVWCSTQGVYPLRGAIADLIGMPPERVRIIHVEGAGCYGHNGYDDVAADAALLAREVGRPVRVQWSRGDEFAWEPYGPAMMMEMQGGVDVQGNVVAWEYQGWSPSHANHADLGRDFLAGQLVSGQSRGGTGRFRGGDRNAPTNYEFPNDRVTTHWLHHSPVRVSSFRSLGAFANTFANESFMDELASAAQIDPLEFRVRHLNDPRALEVLRTAAQASGWGTILPPLEGRGIAFARYENDQAYVAAVAQVRVDPPRGDLAVKRIVIAHDCGLIINPDGLRNQIEGGALQATSRALKEQVTFDENRITSRDWDSYPILKFSEVPEVEVILLDRRDQPALGAGEPATIVVAPAIANAVFAASGVRLRQIPFTPNRIKAAASRQTDS